MRGNTVTLEIEHHDEENTFHTTYNPQKYIEYRAKLQTALRRRLDAEGISHNVVLNPGPPKGYTEYQNVKNWYVHPRDSAKRVRYPRLGSFEVVLKCSNLAGVPDKLLVWSKLASRKWPDVDRLSGDLTRLIVDGQQNEDVSDLVRRLSSCTSSRPAEDMDNSNCSSARPLSPRRPSNPPMFYSTSPRHVVPSPVEKRTPNGDKGRTMSPAPQRPISATLPIRPPRPQSAKRPQSAVRHSPGPRQTWEQAQHHSGAGQTQQGLKADSPNGRQDAGLAPIRSTWGQKESLPSEGHDPWEDTPSTSARTASLPPLASATVPDAAHKSVASTPPGAASGAASARAPVPPQASASTTAASPRAAGLTAAAAPAAPGARPVSAPIPRAAQQAASVAAATTMATDYDEDEFDDGIEDDFEYPPSAPQPPPTGPASAPPRPESRAQATSPSSPARPESRAQAAPPSSPPRPESRAQAAPPARQESYEDEFEDSIRDEIEDVPPKPQPPTPAPAPRAPVAAAPSIGLAKHPAPAAPSKQISYDEYDEEFEEEFEEPSPAHASGSHLRNTGGIVNLDDEDDDIYEEEDFENTLEDIVIPSKPAERIEAGGKAYEYAEDIVDDDSDGDAEAERRAANKYDYAEDNADYSDSFED